MQLPHDIRDDLVDELDEVLDAYATEPDATVVAAHLIEQFEILAEEEGYEDVIGLLERGSELETSLTEALEDEIAELADYDGEELVGLLERLTALDWEDDDADDDEEEAPTGQGWDDDDDWDADDDEDEQDWSDGDDLFDDVDEDDEDDDY